jgi:Rrf2 family protein
MKFSQRSEYGVRLMVDLARHFGQGPLSLSEVARDENLSQTYLEQVIMPLRKAGLVQSRQGVRGGYELSRPPEEIRMGEVLRVLEGSLAPMFCVTDAEARDICAFEDHCATRVLWARVRDGINMALDSTTLADLLPPPVVRVGGDAVPLALPMMVAAQARHGYKSAES